MGNQFWRWNSYGSIASAQGGYKKCLDLPEDKPYLQIWDCNGHYNQKWAYGKIYYNGVIYPQSTGWKSCMDIDYGEPAVNGRKMVMAPCSHDSNNGELWLANFQGS